MNQEHKHTWINQWDRRVCGECGFTEFNDMHIKTQSEIDQEGANDDKPTKAVGKRSGKASGGEVTVEGSDIEKAANVGAVEGIS